VLRIVARGFGNRRLHDEAFRIGGDEFAVVFPGCDEAAARAAIRRMVDELDLGALTARGISFGVSFGIAAGETDPKALHAAADGELTTAKRLGYMRQAAPGSVRAGTGRVRLSA
jgi:GGDEF domain-containing protein